MQRLPIIFILTIAFLLRVAWLESYPIGFTPDEASFGYDAYSLLTTGKDQWGQKLPLVLESFGDFKSPLYAYLSIPSIAIFGLTKFATRLPNAILGTLAVLIIYFLVKEIRKLTKSKYLVFGFWRTSSTVPLEIIASLLLAVSSWHVMMSRGAFEANLTTFFLPLGIYLFLLGQKNIKYLTLSAIVFGLNLFTYHSAKFVTPLFFISLLIIFKKEISRKALLIPISIFAMFLVLTVYTFSVGAGSRISDVNILKNSLSSAATERIFANSRGMPDFLARLMHNKFQVAGRQFLKNYMSYFSPQFLFSDGPSETTYGMIPGRGVLYWFESIFLVGFILYVLREKPSMPVRVIILWLLVSPIPAALSIGPGYAANRAAIMVPAIQIISAIGAIYLFGTLKKVVQKSVFKFAMSFTVLFSVAIFVFFLEDYFIQSTRKQAHGMLYGNLELANMLRQEEFADREIIVSRKLSEPHIYIAFANKFDPLDYQTEVKNWNYKEQGLDWVDQLGEYKLGSYLFKNIDWNSDRHKTSILVGRPEEFPYELIPTKTIFYPDNTPSIYIVDPLEKIYAEKFN